MNILQLSKNQPCPPTSGEETRIWRTTKQLAQIGKVWLASPWDSDVVPPEDINVLPMNSPLLTWKTLQNDLWYGGFLFRHHPLVTIMTNRIVAAIRRQNLSFDIVVSESPQLMDAAKKIATGHSAPVLHNKHNAYYRYLDQYLEDKSFPRSVRHRAVRNMRKYEQQGIDNADAVVFMSENDQKAFSLSTTTISKIIPNGTDISHIQGGDNPASLIAELGIDTSKPVCVFVGSFDYDPNQGAAKIISTDLAPALPEVEFLLVGRRPPRSTPENVYTPGYVNDLSDILYLADIALCPLPRGSGTKLKMLDYLAAGLPIVTTTVGTQGIPIEDGVHAIVRDNPAEIVTALQMLINSPKLQDYLAENACDLGQQYDWKSLMSRYDTLLKRLVEVEHQFPSSQKR
ncbi:MULTISPECIES: glycosyltransferase family 4 protein [Halorussus]|uniref:glycosyltransferase family 4 protein n=1 Tax=Halorussus TaxID=1070314 RepID=UPI000E21798E|nr:MULTISPECIES: glycosyltransferase family 4 protein [Halorussus]NHN58561.1 glycosyltransferase family 4 protein [Halorussus sp. JP-T4]